MTFDPSFLCFEVLFQKKYKSLVSEVKKVLTSAFLIIKIGDDVIGTSRDVMTSCVGFFYFKSFLSLISNYCPSMKSIG